MTDTMIVHREGTKAKGRSRRQEEAASEAPLSPKKLKQLTRLGPLSKPPARFALNVGTFRMPANSRASFARFDGRRDQYRLKLEIAGKDFGRRLEFEPIPTQSLKAVNLRGMEPARALDGLRSPYLPVDFWPRQLRLEKRTHAGHNGHNGDKRRKGLDRPTNVFSPDQRYIYQDTSFPWCTVGRVTTAGGSCTGTTIGSRLLLTASHCINWNSDGTAGWVRFQPAYYNGPGPFGEAWATRVIYWNKAQGGLSNFETAFDYVVCVLDSRIGDVVGYPGYRSYDDDWNGGSYWQHMGYPSDLSGGQRPSFQGDAIVSSVSDESTSGQTGYVMGHFNDTSPGHSGGPAWGWWSGEPWPRIVGTQSAAASTPAYNTSGDNEFGGGPALSALISWARSNYP